MTDKYIQGLINKLNRKKTNGLIHLRPLAPTVDFAKVWMEKPKPTDKISFPCGPYHLYFIKNEDKEYIGAVVDMSAADLHWFVRRKDRGKGKLTMALSETILPHLFLSRKEQRVTIDEHRIGRHNFLRSEKVAISVGFEMTDRREYQLKRNKRFHEGAKGLNSEISEARITELKRHIHYLSRSLWMIQTELEMKMGDESYGKQLEKIRENLDRHTLRVEDVWWGHKKKE